MLPFVPFAEPASTDCTTLELTDPLVQALDYQSTALIAALAATCRIFYQRLQPLCQKHQDCAEATAVSKLRHTGSGLIASTISRVKSLDDIDWSAQGLVSDDLRVLFMHTLRPRAGHPPMDCTFSASMTTSWSLAAGSSLLRSQTLHPTCSRSSCAILRNTRLGDGSVMALAELLHGGHFGKLEDLDLEHNPISDHARSAIRCACGARVVELVLDPFAWTGTSTRSGYSSIWVGLKEALFNFKLA